MLRASVLRPGGRGTEAWGPRALVSNLVTGYGSNQLELSRIRLLPSIHEESTDVGFPDAEAERWSHPGGRHEGTRGAPPPPQTDCQHARAPGRPDATQLHSHCAAQ